MKQYLLPVLCLIGAAGIQGSLPPALCLFGARPDLVLVVLVAYSLAAEPTFGATLGFVAGLLHGASVGMAVGSFIVTRTLTGFLASLVTTRLFSENPVVPTVAAAGLTLVCEGLFAISNPRAPFVPAARTIAGECIYNALLALILYWILRGVQTRRKISLVNARI